MLDINTYKHQVDFNDEVTGLIYGFVFQSQQPPRRIASAQVAAEYAQPLKGSDFIWLHINLNHAAAEKWLKKQFDIKEFFFDEIRNGSRSTRIESQDDVLFAVLNDATLHEDGTSDETATLWQYCRPGLVVTARYKPLRLIEQLFRELGRWAPISSTDILVHLLEEQEAALEQIVRQANLYVDQIEECLPGRHVKENRTRLGRIRRQLLRFQRLLAPEPAALFRLMNRPPLWLNTGVVQNLRQFAEEFTVVLNDLAGLTERIRLLQEEISAGQMEQNNRTLYVLTVITVLALPINIIAGFFGMNVGGIPFSGNPHGFLLLVLFVTFFTLLVGWYALRRRDDD